jgi:hypothetical protein
MRPADRLTFALALGGVWIALALMFAVCLLLASRGPCDPQDAQRASCAARTAQR